MSAKSRGFAGHRHTSVFATSGETSAQPDLNWDTSEIRAAIYTMLKKVFAGRDTMLDMLFHFEHELVLGNLPDAPTLTLRPWETPVSRRRA